MKKLLYAYLTLVILLKAVSCGYSLIAGTSGLPAIIFTVSLALVIFGAAVLVRRFMGKDKPNELALYFSAYAVGTTFNLIFVNMEVLSEISIFDMAVIGTIFDVVLAVVVLAVCLVQRNAASNAADRHYLHQTEEAVGKAQ